MALSCSITGDDDHLIKHLRESFIKAKKVDLIVSFLMESGVKLIQNDLKALRERQVPIRILTGNYMNITQPSALYLLKDILGPDADIRFYNKPNRSFHAKTYFFEYEEGAELYIGSSNLSESALTSGIEWNFKLNRATHEVEYNHYYHTFEQLFLNQSIIVDDKELDRYSKSWVKPKVVRMPLSEIQDEVAEQIATYVTNLYEPRGAQIEALYHLKQTREAGYDKGLVVAATGIGKTFLAAFDSKNFKKVLFVAHREEILKQAAQSFKYVNPMKSTGLVCGEFKETEADLIFASVQTLGKASYLEQFERDHFDYIVVDEFHHAVAKQYQNIIDYFKPKFMLGLTATPQRLDNQDVLALCDYNLVYDASLTKAINQRWLVPFRYYGIYDQTVNYDEIALKNGKYDVKALEEALSIHKRGELVVSHYKKFKSKCALGFCVSRQHADYMARYFNEKGIKACSVHSGSNSDVSLPRDVAISKLKNAELDIIFSVDMFNEGLDIKEVDMVLFLRPTESPTIFLQQLGRGLRTSTDKQYLNVLDFIGNFKKVSLIPFLLTGIKEEGCTKASDIIREAELLPEECFINFDFQLIDLIERMERKIIKVDDLIKEDYERVKAELGTVPSRMEFMTLMEPQIYDLMRDKSKFKVFKDYLTFLNECGDLDENEKRIVDTIAHDFLKIIGQTDMKRLYKIPVLRTFLTNNELILHKTHEEILDEVIAYYGIAKNKVDMYRFDSNRDFEKWSRKKYMSVVKSNPIKSLTTGDEGVYFTNHSDSLTITKALSPYLNDECFIKHLQDTLKWLEHKFYLDRLDEQS